MSDLSPVEALIRSGKKIAAIKEFRTRTGTGLKEAKQAVEWYQAHGQWPPQYLGVVASTPDRPQVQDKRLAKVEQLVTSGNAIHAIKELRALTHLSLRLAKQAVDRYRATRSWPASLVAALGAPRAPAPSAPPPPPSEEQQQLEQLIARRQMLAAIKRFRQITGWGLREAKGAIEYYQAHGSWSARALAMLDRDHHASVS